MNHEACPTCGGILVWDYASGLVVCSSCGLVVDHVYDYGPVKQDEETLIWSNVKTRKNPRRNPVLTRYSHHYKLYRRAYSYVKNKPWLEIDYDKVFESGRLIHTIKSHATMEAEKNIKDRNLWETVEHGLRIIEEKNPAALARSGRGRYALAYMVATYVDKHTFPTLTEVVNIFNISETSYRRLLKIAREITVYVKPVVNR